MRLRHAMPCLTLLLLAACETPAAPDGTASGGTLNRAQTWTLCQDPNRGLAAANACTALIESGQENPQSLKFIHYNRGLALSRRGRTQAAIDDFDIVLKQDPQFALALYQRGLAYQALGQQARGDQDLRMARQLNPRLP